MNRRARTSACSSRSPAHRALRPAAIARPHRGSGRSRGESHDGTHRRASSPTPPQDVSARTEVTTEPRCRHRGASGAGWAGMETGPPPVVVGRFAPHRKSEGPSHQLGPSAVDPARGHRQRVHRMERGCVQVSGGRTERLGHERPRLRADLHVVLHVVLHLPTGLPRSYVLRQVLPEARIRRGSSAGQRAPRAKPR